MPSSVLTTSYKLGDGLPFSPSSLIEEYLHGIPLTDQFGNSYSIKDIRKKILKAMRQIEVFLNISVLEVTREETQDYLQEEWQSWGHIKLERICNEILSVEGFLNSQKVIEFGKDMWVVKEKNIALVPSAQNWSANIWLGTGGSFPVLRGGVRMVPNFWHIVYKTGFAIIPEEILAAISKLASIQILAVLGDILLGAGIASQSISYDGLSQSINTTQSAENSAYSARIKQYAEELSKTDLPQLKSYYRGIVFETI